MVAFVWMRRRKKTLANDNLRWSKEMIGKMEESCEEVEVAHVRMPMTWQKVIGEKNRAREINLKILGFIFPSGLQLLLYGLQLLINKIVEVHYCVDEVGGDFQEWGRRKTCLKVGKGRFGNNWLVCGF